MPADAREQLAAGALALLPTDTVYGIACAAADADACWRLYELKQRPQTQATAIMLGSVPGLLAAVPELPQRQAELCRELLPGTLTLLVSNPAGRFAHVCGDDPTRIGVRVPGLLDEVAVLADAAGGLLITSANQRGDPDPAELAEVPASFRERAAFAVDGGRLPGAPSAVLDISGEEPHLLRAGPGGEEAMAAVSGRPQPSPIEQLMERERRLLVRLDPQAAAAAVRDGAVIVDTRSHEQRTRGGVVPGSIRIHRNVLEWRVDPSSPWCDPRLAGHTGPVIVMCEQGYSSSLAAATLQRLGVARATDMIGGFEAWRAAGLPVESQEG